MVSMAFIIKSMVFDIGREVYVSVSCDVCFIDLDALVNFTTGSFVYFLADT